MTDRIAIVFAGETLHAAAGEPLAATLAAHGRLTLRTNRQGEPRGLFCGIGACQECLVTVDGVPGRRACMVKVDRPMTVEPGADDRPLPPAATAPPPALIDDYPVLRPDLLVVGAGPGGLAAALAAGRAGLEVLLVDERAMAGGQYFKQSVAGGALDRQQAAGARLIADVRAAGVSIRHDVSVWGAYPPRGFVCSGGGRTWLVEPAAAIVATGAQEVGWPVPGWTLPGVMTSGAAQTLWRTARRLPGRRVLIAGNGPLNLQLAAELQGGGADIVAVVEAAHRPRPSDLPTLARMAAAAPGLFAQGAALAQALRAKMRHGSHVARIEPARDGLAVTVGDERLTADILCLGYGFRPAGELLRLLGASHAVNAAGHRRVLRDMDGATSVAGVFAIGDCTGLGGAHAAQAEGTIAGLVVARLLGRGEDAGAKRRARRTLARHRRFQAALWRLYATDLAPPSTPETVLCRCEDVTFARIADAQAAGLSTVGAIKQETRCGMGRCQGRYCAPILEALLGGERDEWTGFAPRMPVAPVAIGDLAP